ncbi:hypothetical protein EI94DRAFT_559496 [Lactarius quietus]|nr:hypothetical protein EI94DRAFT_559496 [Lactarius quietus]
MFEKSNKGLERGGGTWRVNIGTDEVERFRVDSLVSVSADRASSLSRCSALFPVRGHWSLTRSGLSQNNTLGLVQPKVARQLNLSLPSRFRVHLSSDNRLCLLRTMHSLRNPKPFYHQELVTSITGFLPLSGSNHLTAHTNRLPQSTNTYLARTTCLFCHNPSMKSFRLTKSLLIPPSLMYALSFLPSTSEVGCASPFFSSFDSLSTKTLRQ